MATKKSAKKTATGAGAKVGTKKRLTKKGTAKATKRRPVAAKKGGKTRAVRRAKKKAERTSAKKTTHKKKEVVEKSTAAGAARKTRKTATARKKERALERGATPTRLEQRRERIHEKKETLTRAATVRASGRKAATKGALTTAALQRTRALARATGSIHEVAWLPAIPLDVYNAFLDSEQHAAMTGGAAEISAKVGEAFTAWDEYIHGRNLELLPGQRIVQEWWTTEWPEDAPPSRLTLTFFEQDGGTELHLTHEGVPKDDVEKYAEGWRIHYLEPMHAYFRG